MEKRINNRRYLIVTIVVVVMAVAAIVLGVVLWREPEIEEGFFQSDDSKTVVKLDKFTAAFDESEYEPDTTYVVYYHDGENVNKMQVFFVYDTNEEARAANDGIEMSDKDWALTKKVNGRYVIFDAVRARYDGLTKDVVQENAKMLEM
ncbi:hypothetical protein IJ117_02110 [Candidatus Saccharibacteria bacterium]|nr:hypothetical protein [Candidatus Saccharibacteria bacterium]